MYNKGRYNNLEKYNDISLSDTWIHFISIGNILNMHLKKNINIYWKFISSNFHMVTHALKIMNNIKIKYNHRSVLYTICRLI